MAGLVSSDEVAPGASTEISVTLDTTGKSGTVIKVIDIISNDATRPLVRVPVSAEVEHGLPDGSEEDLEAALFGRVDCSPCHAVPAEGLRGGPLYDAVCRMCHGPMPEYIASLPAEVRVRQALHSWISEGRGEDGMPGYSEQAGGPLDEGQIDSLVETMLNAKPEQRTGED